MFHTPLSKARIFSIARWRCLRRCVLAVRVRLVQAPAALGESGLDLRGMACRETRDSKTNVLFPDVVCISFFLSSRCVCTKKLRFQLPDAQERALARRTWTRMASIVVTGDHPVAVRAWRELGCLFGGTYESTWRVGRFFLEVFR